MTTPPADREPGTSTVRIAADFRDNLIIDRYDPVFTEMRGLKVKHLRSANSEDAVTWNVFRSLRQVDPTIWLPQLWQTAFPKLASLSDALATVRLWERVAPPTALLASGDEGHSEIDVLIETGSWVWFIEAKLGSDISTKTRTREARDQVLRNVDVGSFYAQTRSFFFSLLVRDHERSPTSASKVDEYADLDRLRAALPHRADGAKNVQGLSVLTWQQVAGVLSYVETATQRSDEKEFAARARSWLETREIVSPKA
jgi:hypothetical protein